MPCFARYACHPKKAHPIWSRLWGSTATPQRLNASTPQRFNASTLQRFKRLFSNAACPLLFTACSLSIVAFNALLAKPQQEQKTQVFFLYRFATNMHRSGITPTGCNEWQQVACTNRNGQRQALRAACAGLAAPLLHATSCPAQARYVQRATCEARHAATRQHGHYQSMRAARRLACAAHAHAAPATRPHRG